MESSESVKFVKMSVPLPKKLRGALIFVNPEIRAVTLPLRTASITETDPAGVPAALTPAPIALTMESAISFSRAERIKLAGFGPSTNSQIAN
jgi:hypothetical protein